ncbi:MAG TPA: sigma-70 family RNA polymerase sigma factor [Planctomycetota bacterium]|nr:sigma-70 family RNA polymerase sigma factor [Planctomycetota bacterium]
MTATNPFQASPAELLAHDRWLRALARSLVHGTNVDDLVQDTWLAAAVCRPDTRRPLRSWLATVLRRLAARGHRGAARRRERELGAPRGGDVPSTAATVALLDLQRRVSAAVSAMAEPYRTSVLLRFFHGLDHAEIAARSGVNEVAARKRVARGLEMLRAELQRTDSGWQRSPAMLALAAPTAPPTAPWSPLLPGAVLMSNTVKIVGAAALVTIVAIGIGWWSAELPPQVQPVATAQPGVATAAPAAPPEAPVDPAGSAGLEREQVAAAPAAPAHAPSTVMRHRGRVLDPRGRPLAGVPIVVADRLPGSGSDASTERLRDRVPADVRQLTPELQPPGEGPDLAALPVLDESAADGSFAVASDRYGYTLAGPGWATLRSPPVGSGRVDDLLLVAAPAVRIEGRVLDESGAPLARVRIEITAPVLGDFPSALDATKKVDPAARHSTGDGAFAIDSLPAGGGSVAFHLDGYETVRLDVPIATRTGEVVVLRQIADPRVALGGVVVDAFRVPVAGALVGLGERAVHTDEHGRFGLEYPSAAERPPDDAALFVAKSGHRTLVVPAYGAMLRGGSKRDVELQLEGPALAIRGRVFDANGAPLAEALVYLWNEPSLLSDRTAEELGMEPSAPLQQIGPGIRVFAKTDATGSFELGGLRAREYRLHVLLERPRAGFTSVPIAAGQDGIELRAPADLIHERIAGTVVTRGGEPVGGVRLSPSLAIYLVHGTGRYGDGLRGTISDREGRWELHDVPRQDSWIGYRGDGVVPGMFEVDPGRPLDDQRIVVVALRHLRLAVDPSRGAAGFRALDGAGKSLPIMELTPGGTLSRTQWPLRDGQSGVLAVAEDITTIVIDGASGEIVRLPVVLKAGEVTEVRY